MSESERSGWQKLLRSKASSDERLTRPVEKLEMDQDLWQQRIISDEQFLHSIEDVVSDYRKMLMAAQDRTPRSARPTARKLDIDPKEPV
ncbi:MAG TPA: hypothetical protein PKE47_09670 [Verrucomicrobiota bacterium]|nr:hypothetical protein [Verrucomicrobiota bacterium]